MSLPHCFGFCRCRWPGPTWRWALPRIGPGWRAGLDAPRFPSSRISRIKHARLWAQLPVDECAARLKTSLDGGLDEAEVLAGGPAAAQLAATLPAALEGDDILGLAQTGTGKTAAFSLPLIDRIVRAGEKWRRTTVLILTPTRELACQVVENIQSYSQYVPVRCEAIYGGVPINNQIRQLRKGVNIIVATPGRLLDHVKQRTLDLRDIESIKLGCGARI